MKGPASGVMDQEMMRGPVGDCSGTKQKILMKKLKITRAQK